jgi:Flp pilus assembly protein TadG
MAAPRRRRAFRLADRGVSAMEFALLAPVLLALMLGVSEVGRYIYLRFKLVNVAAGIGDLVARLDAADEDVIENLIATTPTMLRPFAAGPRAAAFVTGVSRVAGATTTRVGWRVGWGDLVAASTVGAVNATAVVPPDLAAAGGEALIVTEVFYRYDAWLLNFIPTQTIREVSYARPRRAPLTALE